MMNIGEFRKVVIDHATSGDNILVAGEPGKRIVMMGFFLVAAGAVNARFESDAGGTALTGVMTLAAAGDQINASWQADGHFETKPGQALNLELSGAVSVDGWAVVFVGP